MTLDGARILLVGGTSGLGLAVAQAAAERGATPIVVSRNPASVDRALVILPERAEGATVDLADTGSIARLVEHARPIDHLVYTAGEPLQLTMVPDLTPEIAWSFWETRYFGALNTADGASDADPDKDDPHFSAPVVVGSQTYNCGGYQHTDSTDATSSFSAVIGTTPIEQPSRKVRSSQVKR